ncbi:hypothetical protein [Bacillus sp. OTU530]|uniref:hypothetical protein n=1 Tax=Bacillus sp. OTU530 TaxID=3043862 RepID=UPI00313D4401
MKDKLKQWKADLREIQEEKRLKKQKHKKSKKFSANTSDLMGVNQPKYMKNKGRWRQK